MIKTPPSNAGDAGSIPGWGTKIPHISEAAKPACNKQGSPCAAMKTQHNQNLKNNKVKRKEELILTNRANPLPRALTGFLQGGYSYFADRMFCEAQMNYAWRRKCYQQWKKKKTNQKTGPI